MIIIPSLYPVRRYNRCRYKRFLLYSERSSTGLKQKGHADACEKDTEDGECSGKKTSFSPLKIKFLGKIARFKDRLVGKQLTQVARVDLTKTFSPVFMKKVFGF